MRSNSAVSSPALAICSVSGFAANAAAEGSAGAMAAVRVTRPPSWSIPRMGSSNESSRRSSVNFLTCCGVSMFRVKRMNPAGWSFLKSATSSGESSVPFIPSSSSEPSIAEAKPIPRRTASLPILPRHKQRMRETLRLRIRLCTHALDVPVKLSERFRETLVLIRRPIHHPTTRVERRLRVCDPVAVVKPGVPLLHERIRAVVHIKEDRVVAVIARPVDQLRDIADVDADPGDHRQAGR